MQELLCRFLNHKTLKGGSYRTQLSFRGCLQRFFSHSRVCRLADITCERVGEFERWLLHAGLTHKSINSYLVAIRSLLRWCEAQGMPCMDYRKVELHREHSRTTEILTADQVAKLLAVIDTGRIEGVRDLAIFSLLFASALRVGELCALQRGDIDLEHREAIVRHGKGDKDRWVFFDEATADRIATYWSYRRDRYTPAFINHQGWNVDSGCLLSPRSVQRKLKGYADRCGFVINVHPHTLRHSCLSHLDERGMPFHLLQKLSGHAKADTLIHYLHVKKERVKREYDKAQNNA